MDFVTVDPGAVTVTMAVTVSVTAAGHEQTVVGAGAGFEVVTGTTVVVG